MALLMKRHAGVEPLVHFTCRDRNLIGLQSDIYRFPLGDDPASIMR